jgi:hypothetical protein
MSCTFLVTMDDALCKTATPREPCQARVIQSWVDLVVLSM